MRFFPDSAHVFDGHSARASSTLTSRHPPESLRYGVEQHTPRDFDDRGATAEDLAVLVAKVVNTHVQALLQGSADGREPVPEAVTALAATQVLPDPGRIEQRLLRHQREPQIDLATQGRPVAAHRSHERPDSRESVGKAAAPERLEPGPQGDTGGDVAEQLIQVHKPRARGSVSPDDS